VLIGKSHRKKGEAISGFNPPNQVARNRVLASLFGISWLQHAFLKLLIIK